MDQKISRVSLDEFYTLHGYAAAAGHAAGLKGAALDECIAKSLYVTLATIEAERAARVDQRSRLRIVEAPADP